MSSLKPNCTKLLLHLIVTVWKNKSQNLLSISLSFAIKLPVNLSSDRNLQYFLWRFLYINIFFSYFVPHFSSYFLNLVAHTEKRILSWPIKNNSTDVALISVCFCFYTRTENWPSVSVDLHLMPAPSMLSSEFTFPFVASQ